MTLQGHRPPHLDAIRAEVTNLLAAAGNQDAASARHALLALTVRDLVPDEALILAELARRRTAPALHLQTWTRTGLPGQPLLEDASPLGRWAGVALPQLTGHYLGHLRRLGLIEHGPADDRFEDDYQALMADPAVLGVLARVCASSVTPHTVRSSVHLTALGRELCDEAFPAS